MGKQWIYNSHPIIFQKISKSCGIIDVVTSRDSYFLFADANR